MLKIENTEVMGWKHAIRGMRNPKNSWEKSDSGVCATHGPAHCADCVYTDCHADDVEIGTKYILGPNDHDLETIMQMNVDKLKARYPDGFDAEHSLHRNQDDI